MELRAFLEQDRLNVVALWQECGLTKPWNNPDLDIDRKLSMKPEWFLVGLVDDELMATMMVGYEGYRGWVNYLAVARKYRQSGVGRVLMSKAEEMLMAADCPKLNLQVRSTNVAVLEFYCRLGYLQEEVVSLGKRLITD